MDEKIRQAFLDLNLRIAELEEVQGAHRALISQHQAALKSIAQIMEVDRGLDHPL